jgi:hypothetical protein
MKTSEHIRAVCQAFTAELAKLHARSDWPKYRSSKLTLTVDFAVDEGGKFKIQWTQGYGNEVKATDLDKLMAEVWRRNDFDDREEAAINMLALPAPADTSESLRPGFVADNPDL